MNLPGMRRDLEYIPIQYGDKPLVLIRDHLGLVQEGKAVPLSIYQLMTLLDGTRSLLDLQEFLIRQGGGVLVGSEEIKGLVGRLDESFLLDSERFRKAREAVVALFAGERVRDCSLIGKAYPAQADELSERLEEILRLSENGRNPWQRINAIVSPHIDLSAGKIGYANAYENLRRVSPSRVIVLGVGHRLPEGLFCLTEKDFRTPLGLVRSDKELIRQLQASAPEILSKDDFAHRSEHSIEFQILFLQHILPEGSFEIVPILCGSIQSCVPEYTRSAYLTKAVAFIDLLRGVLSDTAEETLLVAGVDLCHIGPKFGHGFPARQLEAQAREHDQSLLDSLCRRDADRFWEESIRVKDQYNVCGFSALACLLEVLPGCEGKVLSHEVWHEQATRSAVSFASAVFGTGC